MIPSTLPAAPVAIINPSGEINNGVDRAEIPHAALGTPVGRAPQRYRRHRC